MNRNQIEYILALAELRNFGRAADACYITQSTLSTMVAKFEEQIGLIIFDRSKRPVGLTPDGEQIITSLQSIYREYQLLDDKVSDIKGEASSHISIACIPTVAAYLYPLVLHEITSQHVKVKFSIYEQTTDQVIESLMTGSVDIGIISTPISHPDLIEESLYTEDFLVYDRRHRTTQKTYKVSDIDLERLWLMEEGHCLRNQIGKICQLRQKKKVKNNLVYNCGSIHTLIDMVDHHQGVTLIPRLVLTNHTQITPSYIHELSAPAPAREIGLVTHKHYRKTKLIEDIASLIKEKVSIHLVPEQDRAVISPF